MVQKFQLKNGMKVLVVPSHKSPVVSVQMWVRTGSADEDARVQGISHFIEHLVFKATERYGLGQIAATVEGSGGELNAYTTFDQTVFYVTISKEFVNTGLDVISQMMGYPLFRQEDIDSEREVVIEEIKRGNDSLHRQASRLLFETVYKKHPYGKPVIGYEKIIRNVTRKQILNYYHSRYVPKNMTLVVAGDFDEKTIRKTIDSYYGGFQSFPLKKVKRALEPTMKASRLKVQKSQFEESLLYLSWPIPKVSHRDIPALDVLALVLGQGDSSRLSQRLRLRDNLVNSIGSSTFTPLDSGFFALSASLTPDKLESALRASMDEILALRDGPIEDHELMKARMNIGSEEAYSLETVDGLARKVGSYQFLFGDPEYQKKFLKAVGNVNAADLSRVVAKYLDPKKLSVIWMTNADTVEHKKSLQKWMSDYKKLWPRRSQTKNRKRTLKIPMSVLKFEKPPLAKQDLLKVQKPQSPTLLLRPSFDAPVVSLKCGFLGGGRRETSQQGGITDLLTRTWVTATKSRTEHQVYAQIEGNAASLSAFGGRNTVGLSLTSLPTSMESMLDLVEEVLFDCNITDEALNREKQSMLEALKNRKDHAAQIAILNFMKTLFRGHPYSQDPLGDPAVISSFQVTDVVQFLRQHLNQQNCVVSVAGHISDSSRSRIDRIFSRLPKGQRYQDRHRFSPPPTKQLVFEASPKEQSHLVIGFPGLSISDPQRYTLQVIQAILAGQGGRLFFELRDKASLAYSVSPLRMEGTDCGYFGAYIGCSPEKVPKALEMLRTEFAKVCNERVSEGELERAKRYLIGRHDIDLQRNSAICSSLLFDEIYGVPYDETFRFAEKVNQVSVDNVRNLAQKILSQNEVISLVGPNNPI